MSMNRLNLHTCGIFSLVSIMLAGTANAQTIGFQHVTSTTSTAGIGNISNSMISGFQVVGGNTYSLSFPNT